MISTGNWETGNQMPTKKLRAHHVSAHLCRCRQMLASIRRWTPCTTLPYLGRQENTRMERGAERWRNKDETRMRLRRKWKNGRKRRMVKWAGKEEWRDNKKKCYFLRSRKQGERARECGARSVRQLSRHPIKTLHASLVEILRVLTTKLTGD